MAIVWVHEALASGKGSGQHDSGNTYERVFDVKSDSYDDNAYTIANAIDPNTSLAIPSPYSYFQKGNDTDYGSIVTKITPERDSRYPLLWHVRVEYSVLRADTSNGQWPGGTLDITFRLPDIRIWKLPVEEIIEYDVITGDPVANSAGDRFDPLPTDTRYRKAIEITFWARTYDLDDWDDYEDSTNADIIWGRDPGTLLMAGPPSGVRKVDNTGTYWENRLEIHYDPKGWKRSYYDRGRRKLVTDDLSPPSASTPATGKAPITDNTGGRVGDDVPLNGGGQPLAEGQDLVTLAFTFKESQPWAPLGLPELNITW